MSDAEEIRRFWPLRVKIATGNAYGLPIGKEFPWARCKDGDASPYPFEVYSYAGDYRIYQLKASEVVVVFEEA